MMISSPVKHNYNETDINEGMPNLSSTKNKSSGFSHFIHNIENKSKHIASEVYNDIKNIPHDISVGVNKIETGIGNEINKAESFVGSQLRKGGNFLKEGANNVVDFETTAIDKAGDALGRFEDQTLPDFSQVIEESVVVLGGLAIIGILLIKFL